MIQQTLLYLLETVEVCVSTINVISQLVLKLLDYIMYLIFMNKLVLYLRPAFKMGTASQMHETAYKKAKVIVPG
jgi:hypothetical protein